MVLSKLYENISGKFLMQKMHLETCKIQTLFYFVAFFLYIFIDYLLVQNGFILADIDPVYTSKFRSILGEIGFKKIDLGQV
jgi:hypothetical protein